MAPATLAGAAPRVRRAGGGWDRDSIIEAIQEWVALYGEPPRAADWNPSSAKWSGQLWRVERYRAGRADGSPWPALNSAKRPFGGSLSEAIRAAGFEPAKPGPVRRRDVDPEQASRAVISPEGRAMLGAALAQARDARRRVASLEGQLARAQRRAARLAEERDAAQAAGFRAARAAAPAKAKVIRERVVDDAAVDRARKRAEGAEAKAAAVVRELREQIAAGRMDAAEARAIAKRLAAKLERAEATVSELRAERRGLKAERDRAADELVAAERARAQAAEPAVVTVREAPDAKVVRDAQAAEAAAQRAAREAELRAARAERELRETVAAVKGEPRRLTAAELAELRSAGPSGPAVMAGALKALSAARAAGSESDMRAALADIARAAVTWQERI